LVVLQGLLAEPKRPVWAEAEETFLVGQDLAVCCALYICVGEVLLGRKNDLVFLQDSDPAQGKQEESSQ